MLNCDDEHDNIYIASTKTTKLLTLDLLVTIVSTDVSYSFWGNVKLWPNQQVHSIRHQFQMLF